MRCEAAYVFDEEMVATITTAMTTTTSAEQLAHACEFALQRSGLAPVSSSSIPAMRPISVCMPVAVTIALPWPYVAAVPLKIMLS